MDQQIEEIYRNRINELSEQPQFRRAVELVRLAEKKNGVKVRADATLFLAVNVLELAVFPLSILAQQGDVDGGAFLSEDEVFARAGRDIDVIVREAEQIRLDRDSEEISASISFTFVKDICFAVMESVSIRDQTAWA